MPVGRVDPVGSSIIFFSYTPSTILPLSYPTHGRTNRNLPKLCWLDAYRRRAVCIMYKKGQVTPVDDRGLSIPNRHVSVYFFIRGKKKGKKYDYPLSLFHHYSPRVPTRPFSSDRQFFKYLDPSVDFGHVLISLCKDLLTGDSYTDVYRI
jgi:hypothetical protein